jgi:hypothetical protein
LLSLAQMKALAHVRARGNADRARAQALLAATFARAGASPSASERLLAHVRERARVTLNFHPDRPMADGSGMIAEGILRDGRYRSQFETRTSSGSVTAYPGGDRDVWEKNLFGGAYHEAEFRPEERPKYGALNLFGHADGASPRFGSCHFRLRAHVSDRCTFTSGDSHLGPAYAGTIEAIEAVLADHLASIAHVDLCALAEGRLDSSVLGRRIGGYVETQVHGACDLAADAEALIADASFRGTPAEGALTAIAQKYSLAFSWHPGFRLAVRGVPDRERGDAIPELSTLPDWANAWDMPALAARVDRLFGGTGGLLDAAVLGRAFNSLRRDPESWSDLGPELANRQLKFLWLAIVVCG